MHLYDVPEFTGSVEKSWSREGSFSARKPRPALQCGNCFLFLGKRKASNRLYLKTNREEEIGTDRRFEPENPRNQLN